MESFRSAGSLFEISVTSGRELLDPAFGGSPAVLSPADKCPQDQQCLLQREVIPKNQQLLALRATGLFTWWEWLMEGDKLASEAPRNH